MSDVDDHAHDGNVRFAPTAAPSERSALAAGSCHDWPRSCIGLRGAPRVDHDLGRIPCLDAVALVAEEGAERLGGVS
jgi:hypothetical protein